VAVEVEEVESEIGESLGPALAQRLGQRIDMGDATLAGHRDLTVEDHRGQSGVGERPKRFAEHRGAVVAVAADERDVAAADPLQARGAPPRGLDGAAAVRLIASSRCPSYLISCSQPSPSGGAAQGETIRRRTERGISAGTAASGKAKFDMEVWEMWAAGGRLPSYPELRPGFTRATTPAAAPFALPDGPCRRAAKLRRSGTD
jgi:hypothetical protein